MPRRATLRTLLSGRQEIGSFAPELLGIDRILQRWAVSVMGGMPGEVWDDSTTTARPPPLDEDCAYIVDRLVLSSPRKQRKVINLWYRKPLPTKEIARKMGVSSSGLYLLMNATLGYVRGRILREGHPTLTQLAKARETGDEASASVRWD